MSSYGALHGQVGSLAVNRTPDTGIPGGVANTSAQPPLGQQVFNHPDIGQSAQQIARARHNPVDYQDPNAAQQHSMRYWGVDSNPSDNDFALIIAASITQSVSAINLLAMPYRHRTESSKIEWQQELYPPGMLENVPVRGMPKRFTNSREHRNASMTRVGAAITAEASQWLHTADGARVMANTIKQCQQAGITRIYVEVINAIFSCHDHAQAWAARFNNSPSPLRAVQAQAAAHKNFMGVNKTPNFLNFMVADATDILQTADKKPVAMILPQRAVAFANTSPFEMSYSAKGPKAKGSEDIVRNLSVKAISGLVVIESVPVPTGGQNHNDLTSRTVRIPTASVIKTSNRSNTSTIYRQDGTDGGGFVDISAVEALRYSQLFNRDGNTNNEYILQYIRESAAARHGKPLSPFIVRQAPHAVGNDMSMPYGVVTHLGEMEQAFVSDKTARSLARKMCEYLQYQLGKEQYAKAMADIGAYISLFDSAVMSSDVYMASVMHAAGMAADREGFGIYSQNYSSGVPDLADGLAVTFSMMSRTKGCGVGTYADPAAIQTAYGTGAFKGADATMTEVQKMFGKLRAGPKPNATTPFPTFNDAASFGPEIGGTADVECFSRKAVGDVQDGEMGFWNALLVQKMNNVRDRIKDKLVDDEWSLPTDDAVSNRSAAKTLTKEIKKAQCAAVHAACSAAVSMPTTGNLAPLGYQTYYGALFLEKQAPEGAVHTIYAKACDAAGPAVRAFNQIFDQLSAAMQASCLSAETPGSIFTALGSSDNINRGRVWDYLVANSGSPIFVPIASSEPAVTSPEVAAAARAPTEIMDQLLLLPGPLRLLKGNGQSLGYNSTFDSQWSAFTQQPFWTSDEEEMLKIGAGLAGVKPMLQASLVHAWDAVNGQGNQKIKNHFRNVLENLSSALHSIDPLQESAFNDLRDIFIGAIVSLNALANLAPKAPSATTDEERGVLELVGGAVENALEHVKPTSICLDGDNLVMDIKDSAQQVAAAPYEFGAGNAVRAANAKISVPVFVGGRGAFSAGAPFTSYVVARGAYTPQGATARMRMVAVPLMMSSAASQRVASYVQAITNQIVAAKKTNHLSLEQLLFWYESPTYSLSYCGVAPQAFPFAVPLTFMLINRRPQEVQNDLRTGRRALASIHRGNGIAHVQLEHRGKFAVGSAVASMTAQKAGLIKTLIGDAYLSSNAISAGTHVNELASPFGTFGSPFMAHMPRDRAALIHSMDLQNRIGSAWIFGEANLTCLESMVNANCPVPFDISLIRFQMYQVASAAVFAASIGYVYWGFADVTTGLDPLEKTTLWHFTMQVAAVVHREHECVLFKDIFGQANLGGAGAGFIPRISAPQPSVEDSQRYHIDRVNEDIQQAYYVALTTADYNYDTELDLWDPEGKAGLGYDCWFHKWAVKPTPAPTIPQPAVAVWTSNTHNGSHISRAWYAARYPDGKVREYAELTPMGDVDDNQCAARRAGAKGTGRPGPAAVETYIRPQLSF